MGIDPDVIRLVMTGAAEGDEGAAEGDERAAEGDERAAEGGTRKDQVRCAMTNSFGFGGTNASLLFTSLGSGL